MSSAQVGSLDFAQYLFDHGALDGIQLAEVRRRCVVQPMSIGRLLLKSSRMTVKDTMRVFAAQADEPHRRFEQIAVEHGYITTCQLHEALHEQRVAQRHQIEIVHQLGLLDEGRFVELVVAYTQLLEMSLSRH